jgi:hypothetical protein
MLSFFGRYLLQNLLEICWKKKLREISKSNAEEPKKEVN